MTTTAPSLRARTRPAAPRVVILGDVLDDIIVAPDSVPRLGSGTGTEARIQHRAGGSAANTAAWLASQGVRVDFVGRVGASDVHRHSQLLTNAGVTPRLAYSPQEPTGTAIITVDGLSGSMLTDRGASAGLDLDSLTDELLAGSSVVHVTGYSIAQSGSPSAFQDFARRVRTAGALLSVDPASSGLLDDGGTVSLVDLVAGADLFLPNLATGRLLTGLDDADAIVTLLQARFGVVAMSLPNGGSVAGRAATKLVHTPPASSRLVDPVGSGDAFSAGFLAGWLHSPSVALSARRGTKLAAQARAVVGGRPPR